MCESRANVSTIDTVLIENERLRVTSWNFPQPEDCTVCHWREYDYVVVPLFNDYLRIDTGSGTVTSSLTTG